MQDSISPYICRGVDWQHDIKLSSVFPNTQIFFLLNLSIIWKIVIIVKCSLNLRWCHLCLRVVTFAFPCWLASISGRAVWAGGLLARVILYPPNTHTHTVCAKQGTKRATSDFYFVPAAYSATFLLLLMHQGKRLLCPINWILIKI